VHLTPTTGVLLTSLQPSTSSSTPVCRKRRCFSDYFHLSVWHNRTMQLPVLLLSGFRRFLYTFGRTPRKGDRPVARLLSAPFRWRNATAFNHGLFSLYAVHSNFKRIMG